MAYRLKKGEENFEIVDGPDAGRKFERDKVYKDRPYHLRGRFEEVPGPALVPELAIEE